MSKIGDNPYPGPRAFGQADQAFFFGRDADTATVTDLWLSNRLTIVSGPAASGKTSLLRAGVYPAMPVKRSRVLPVGSLSHGMTFPFPALGDHNPFTVALLTSWAPDDVPTRLTGLTISDFVRAFLRDEDTASYAVIDQVEDLTFGPRHGAHARWRQQFLTELAQAMADNPRLHLLLVARNEALGLLTSSVGGGARHTVTGLATPGAVEALTRPAAMAGRSFTEEAAYNLLDDLRAPDVAVGRHPDDADYVEPSLLQTVCWPLWESLPTSVTEISNQVIREFGDVDTALAVRCGQVIGEVAALYDITPKRLRTWMVNNFVTDSDRRGVHEGEQTTAGLANGVPQNLLSRYLLTSDVEKSVRYYRLLSRRLAEPLWKASAERPPAPAAADYLRAAERDLATGELGFAWAHGERALRAAAGLRERAQAESLLGNVKYRAGKPGEALPHYRRAAELLQATGDTAAAAHQLAASGRLLLAERELAEALPELRAAVERAPNDLGLQTQLALALWQLGDGQGAVAILNWVLSANGGHAEARRLRGEILADLGEARDALADLDRALPARPSARAARGLALAELGKHTAAAEEIDGALAAERHSGLVLFYAARASDLAGDKIAARDRAKEAINAADSPLSPTHKEQAQRLAGRRPGFAKPARWRP